MGRDGKKMIPCPRGNKQPGPLPSSGWPGPRSHHTASRGVDGPRKLPCHAEADYQQAHHPWLIVTMVAQMGKNLPTMQETGCGSLGQEDPWRRKWQPTAVFLPGKLHGQRSLADSMGPREWDMTEQLSHHHTHSRRPGAGQALLTH